MMHYLQSRATVKDCNLQKSDCKYSNNTKLLYYTKLLLHYTKLYSVYKVRTIELVSSYRFRLSLANDVVFQ